MNKQDKQTHKIELNEIASEVRELGIYIELNLVDRMDFGITTAANLTTDMFLMGLAFDEIIEKLKVKKKEFKKYYKTTIKNNKR